MGNKKSIPEEEVVEEEAPAAAPMPRGSIALAPGVGATAVLGVHGTKGRKSIMIAHTEQLADVEVNPLEWATFQREMKEQFHGKGSLISGMVQLRVEEGKFWRARFVFLNNHDHVLHIFSFDHDADVTALASAAMMETSDAAPSSGRRSSATGIIAESVGGATHEKIPLSTIERVEVEGENTFILHCLSPTRTVEFRAIYLDDKDAWIQAFTLSSPRMVFIMVRLQAMARRHIRKKAAAKAKAKAEAGEFFSCHFMTELFTDLMIFKYHDIFIRMTEY
jgi:hypothetical protein